MREGEIVPRGSPEERQAADRVWDEEDMREAEASAVQPSDSHEEVDMKMRRAPKEPTKEERERHELTHLPYRNWCPVCVRGRGRNTPHRQVKSRDEGGVTRISMDYFFLGDVDQEAAEHPMIVMTDENTRNRYARAVTKKGIPEDG